VRFFRRPHGDAYIETSVAETPGPTPLAMLPGLSIDLTDVLG
jgi:hypothetical protein